MSNTQRVIPLNKVHDVFLDKVQLPVCSSSKCIRFSLFPNSIKNGEADTLLFKLEPSDEREPYDFVVRRDGEDYFLRGDYWENSSEDECEIFIGDDSAIITFDDMYQQVYLTLVWG